MNLEFLQKIVNIDSSSNNLSGIKEVQNVLVEILSSINFEINILKENQDTAGELLFAQRKGISNRAITLVCHADTVLSPSSDFNFKIDFHNSRIYGPGIGDNKGGIALALGALKDYFENYDTFFYTINFICSPSEETGSIGFHSFFEQIGKLSDYIFGFEPALSNGDIICERSGNRWYDINFFGKSGHAGRWNQPSLNAAHLMANFISNIIPLNDYELKRRVNVAQVEAGTSKYNVICDQAKLKLDIRFKDFESRDLMHQKIISEIDESMKQNETVGISNRNSLQIVDDCPPMPISREASDMTNFILEKIKFYEGKKVNASYSGGAADINYFQRIGLVSIDGLGPVTFNMHTKEEYILIDSFYTRRHVFVECLIYLNHQMSDNFDRKVEVNESYIN